MLVYLVSISGKMEKRKSVAGIGLDISIWKSHRGKFGLRGMELGNLRRINDFDTQCPSRR